MEEAKIKKRKFNRAGLSHPAIKELVHRGGVKSAHYLAYLTCEMVLDRFLQRTLWRACISSLHRKNKSASKTLMLEDVERALEIGGMRVTLCKRRLRKAAANFSPKTIAPAEEEQE